MGKVGIIGAGLAGCEAAWAAVNLNADVTLFEMKPHEYTPPINPPFLRSLSAQIPLRLCGLKAPRAF